MITKRTGHGQTVCKGCKDKGKFGLNWDSFLYNFNDEPYCFECLMETLEIYQDRINKAIEYIKENYLFDFKYDNEEIFEIITDDKATRELLEILKGDNNE